MARFTSERYGIPLLPEVARLVLAERELSMETLRSNLDTVDAFQKEIFLRQVREEAGKESFVSDRSFDNLSYAANHSRVMKELFESEELKGYVETLQSPKVVIFFVRPVKSIMREDGIRERADWDELLRIDGMVKMMLEMWGLRYFQISTGSMQERARLVDAVMSEVLRP